MIVLNFDSIISDILATIIGGVILALLFFWIREKFFPLPDFSGRWYFQIETVGTSYRPYEGMIIRYMAMLWREGNRVQGTVEKIYENSSTGERDFVGENRTRGIVEGYLEKNYFSKDRMILHIIEDGHGRESTYFYELTIQKKEKMDGKFTSMVANQDGTIICQRSEF